MEVQVDKEGGEEIFMNRGFFLAQVLPDGGPGKPIGDEEKSAILVFEELTDAVWCMAEEMGRESSVEIAVFQLDIRLIGRVHRT